VLVWLGDDDIVIDSVMWFRGLHGLRPSPDLTLGLARPGLGTTDNVWIWAWFK
jgi:hypothetical protein